MEENEARFNMAIATLMRISDILREINRVEQLLFLSPDQRQAQKVLLVKQLYVQSSPLMTVTQREKIQERVFGLRAFEKEVIVKDGYTQKSGGKRVFYSEELERELNQICVDIQVALQDENYFMPPKKDKTRGVGEF